MRPSILATIILPLGLAGCGYGASQSVHQAQFSMIGMSEADLQSCAGPPDKTIPLNTQAHILNYTYKPGANNGFNVQMPLNLGGVSLGGSGSYCTANFRVVSNTITEVHYSGDNDKAIGDDGVCAPIIRGCLRQPEQTMRPVDGKASAFHAPPVPAQVPAAEVSQ